MNIGKCLNLFPALKIFPSQKVRQHSLLIITHRILHICEGLSVGLQTSNQKWPTEMEDWLKIKS